MSSGGAPVVPLREQPRAITVSLATLAVFLLVGPGRSWLFDVLGVPSAAESSLLVRLAAIHACNLFPPLLLAAVLFGARHALAALGLSGSLLVGFVVAFAGTLPMLLGYAATTPFAAQSDPLLRALRYALLPGTMEEILYRGMLFGFLFRFGGWGFVPAALVNGVFFGIGHLWQGHAFADTAGVFAITSVGAAWFAWLYVEWKANLWVPIGFHVLMNLYWDLFDQGQSALGGGTANVFRTVTVALSVVLTLWAARRRGGRVVRGRRWWRGDVERAVR